MDHIVLTEDIACVKFPNRAYTEESVLFNTNTEPRTYTFPDADISFGTTPAEGSNDTSIPTTASIPVKVATVTLTDAQVKLLRATPITLVAAPGAGYMLELISGVIAFDYTAAYTETADNLAILWGAAGTAASATIETTGFLDATADTIIQVSPATVAARAKTAVDNKALVIHNTGDGEIGGGNAANAVRISITYRIVPLGW